MYQVRHTFVETNPLILRNPSKKVYQLNSESLYALCSVWVNMVLFCKMIHSSRNIRQIRMFLRPTPQETCTKKHTQERSCNLPKTSICTIMHTILSIHVYIQYIRTILMCISLSPWYPEKQTLSQKVQYMP